MESLENDFIIRGTRIMNFFRYLVHLGNDIQWQNSYQDYTMFLCKDHHPLGNFVAATLETSKEILMNLIMTMKFL